MKGDFSFSLGERELSQYTLEAEDLKISKFPENNFSTVSCVNVQWAKHILVSRVGEATFEMYLLT